MSRFSCVCGRVISDVVEPNKNRSFLISDLDLDNYSLKFGELISEAIRKDLGIASDPFQLNLIVYETIYESCKEFWKCGNIYVGKWDDKGFNCYEPKSY